METFIHQLVAGLANGGIYASIALALVMIHQSTHQLNFAQGEMAMFSTFIAWALMKAGLGFWTAFFVTAVASFVMGMAVERVVIRPLGQRSHLALVVVFIGLLLIFNSVAGWIWGYDVRPFPSPFPDTRILGGFATAHQAGSIFITMLLVVGLYAFFRYTPLGLAMRAAAQNPVSSRLVGVRVDFMLGLGWGLAAAIGAVAGMMVAHVLFLEPNMLGAAILYGFAAALVGGINNPWGAVAGGFLLGAVENLLGTYVIGDDMKLTLALVIIVTVLTFKPAGIFGVHHIRRV
ncbi:branched-chain amino acid ABC transporter permease [Ramlibacter sp. Leaf400]|uniref:branched-chain amino acid ABC transporter permease n=1 Tax=Ramlibacter sp. Leaf400 TaxID=1736365 RepID=UPI0006FFA9CA|nr:branched-chain amino acid ABC transporter permease [Ramlibacter sp. Leaf400]KQT09717.1 ABC transporter permease [Ramlibacter sp. Leaf400]